MNTDSLRAPGRGVLLQEAVSRRVLRAFFDVYNGLGRGFLESAHAGAFAIACGDAGLRVAREVGVPVCVRGRVAGEYRADAIVEDVVLVEFKVARAIDPIHVAQVMNYLRATRFEVGMLLNFGPKPEFRRVILENCLKSIRVDPRRSAVPPAEHQAPPALDASTPPAPR